ncbi:MAG: TfoX/Sxy family protein [Flavobacteriales bacterium]|mgnify:CR=1 FL=1|nr:TfoX/Sxy family protein [Flavobacteriales bacterium]
MATRKQTADFILAQVGHPGRFSVKSMFGEFALYADGKPVAFICDDQLFVKILPESASLEDQCERAPAYPGSKDYYLVPEEMITSDRKLPELLLRVAEALPMPKVKKPRRKA